MRADCTGADQVGYACGQHAGLAAARTGKDECGLVREGDSLLLGGVKTGK